MSKVLHIQLQVWNENGDTLHALTKPIEPKRTLTVDALKISLIKELALSQHIPASSPSAYHLLLSSPSAPLPVLLDVVSFCPFSSAHPDIEASLASPAAPPSPIPLILQPVPPAPSRAPSSSRISGFRLGSQANLVSTPRLPAAPLRTLSSTTLARAPRISNPTAQSLDAPPSSSSSSSTSSSTSTTTSSSSTPSSSSSGNRPRTKSSAPSQETKSPRGRRHKHGLLAAKGQGGVASASGPRLPMPVSSDFGMVEQAPGERSPKAPSGTHRRRLKKISHVQDRTKVLSLLRLARTPLANMVAALRAEQGGQEPLTMRAIQRIFDRSMEYVDEAISTPNLSPREISFFERLQAERAQFSEFLALQIDIPRSTPTLSSHLRLMIENRLNAVIAELKTCNSSSCFRQFVPARKSFPQLTSYPLDSILLLQRSIRHWLFRYRFLGIVQSYSKSSESKSLRIRSKLIREIISSEESYHKSLNECIELFIKPLEAQSQSTHPFVTEQDIQKIFLNLQAIYDISTNFLAALNERFSQCSGIQTLADLFLSDTLLESVTKEYSHYTLNYESAIKCFDTLSASNPLAKQFFEEIYNSPNCSHNNLGFYLIMPIQRLPRYRMLLMELQKNTESTHVDYQNIQAALAKVAQAATLINSRKKHLEEMARAKLELENISEFFPTPLDHLPDGRNRLLLSWYKVATHPAKGKTEDVRLYLFDDMLLESHPKHAEPSPAPSASPATSRHRSASLQSTSSSSLLHVTIPQTVLGLYSPTQYDIALYNDATDTSFTLAFFPRNISHGIFFRAYSVASPAEKEEIVEKLSSLSFVKTGASPAPLSVTIEILYANDLPIADLNGFSDPYCVIRYGEHKYRTPTIWKNLNPVWNAKPFRITLDEKHPVVSLNVWDEDLVGSDFLGSVDVPIDLFHQLEPENNLKTFALHDSSYFKLAGIITLRCSIERHQEAFPGIKTKI